MATLIELAKHAGLPVRMATLGDLVRSDSHDPTLAHLNPRYAVPENAQTSEKEAAEMLIDYIAECLTFDQYWETISRKYKSMITSPM